MKTHVDRTVTVNDVPCLYLNISDAGIIQTANPTLCDALCYRRSELVGKHVYAILSPEHHALYEKHIKTLKQEVGALDEVYLSLQSRDGTSLPVVLNLHRQTKKMPALILVAGLRVNRRDQYNAEIQTARKLAEEAHQRASEFLPVISHELRTPLSVISIYTEILLRNLHGELSAQQKEILRNVNDVNRSLLDFLIEILNYSRLDAGHSRLNLRHISLEEILQRVEKDVLPCFKKKDLEYQRQTERDDLRVFTDAAHLQNILNGLLFYIIESSLRNDCIALQIQSQENKVVIEVSRRGIDQPTQEIGFKNEETESRWDVILRLGIWREVLRHLGGTIEIETAQQGNSRFILSLSAFKAGNSLICATNLHSDETTHPLHPLLFPN